MRIERTPPFTLGEIAGALGGTLTGDPVTPIHRVRAPQEARADEIAMIIDAKHRGSIDSLAAAAIVVPAGMKHTRDNVIAVPDVKRAFVALLKLFARPASPPSGIHPRAIVAAGVQLGAAVSIGAGAVIESGASIGDSVRIGANCYVGENVVLGRDSVLHPNVTLYERTVVGERVIIHSGTVIGSDGFSYLELESGARERIPQLGSVEIGDDVEIGVNCGIDRATLEKTIIGRGTKIDNLVQIGHNSHIGEYCCIVGQAGVAGSVTVGNYSVLAGQSGVSDHVTLGERVTLAAKAGVHSDLASGAWLGSPAMPLETAVRVFAALRLLPEYRERVRALEDTLAAMERRVQKVEHPERVATLTVVRGNGKGNGIGYRSEPAEEA